MSDTEIILSAVDGLPVRPSGPWINRKYYFLKQYLHIFSKAMGTKWDGKLTYIDLFAGSGRCVIRPDGEEVEGSALISLGYEFARYIFVEKDPQNMAALKARCANSPKSNQIGFLQGDCNAMVDKIRPSGLSIVFIDPTGIDFSLDAIRKLSADKRVDLLMTIMDGMDIKRNFQRYVHEGDSSPLGQLLGGNVPWSRILTPHDAVEFFKKKLLEMDYKTVEFKDIQVRSNKNRVPLYFLLFASRDPRGLHFWKEITKRDETGQGEFNF